MKLPVKPCSPTDHMPQTFATRKGPMTPEEKIAAAHGYFNHGISQQALASLYAVNPARIGEALKAVRTALWPEADWPGT